MVVLSCKSVVVVLLCCADTHVQAHTRPCPTWKSHLPAAVSVLRAFLCTDTIIKDDEGHAEKQLHYRCCFTFAFPPPVTVQELADDLKSWPVVTFAVVVEAQDELIGYMEFSSTLALRTLTIRFPQASFTRRRDTATHTLIKLQAVGPNIIGEKRKRGRRADLQGSQAPRRRSDGSSSSTDTQKVRVKRRRKTRVRCMVRFEIVHEESHDEQRSTRRRKKKSRSSSSEGTA